MILAMTLDWQMPLFDAGMRTTLTIAALLLAAAAFLATGIPPLRSALTQARAATDADAVVPQLEERWQTVVTMSSAGHHSSSPTALSMLRQVVSAAVATLQIIRPDAAQEELKQEDLKIPSQADRPAAFVQRLHAEESFQYRVRAGDGQTKWHSVTVVEFPALADVRFTIVPPAYLNR